VTSWQIGIYGTDISYGALILQNGDIMTQIPSEPPISEQQWFFRVLERGPVPAAAAHRTIGAENLGLAFQAITCHRFAVPKMWVYNRGVTVAALP
jgi:hypothetical protein